MGVALAELLPLLCQSIDWFEGLVRERGKMSEVRSSELETGFLPLEREIPSFLPLERLRLFTPSRRCMG